MLKFLHSYPFADPAVRLVEGFAAYDGTLNDEPGAPHKGIDYALPVDDTFVAFDVFAMHDGLAYQGVSDTWGEFVSIYAQAADGMRMSTVYAHLDDIPSSIVPLLVEENGSLVKNPQGTPIKAGTRIGRAGTSGRTHGQNQLHLELHQKNLADGSRLKLDPYGIDDRASSGRYPQPGHSLSGLTHAWLYDLPPYAR